MTTVATTRVNFSVIAKDKRTKSIETTLESPTDETISQFEHNKQYGIFRILDQKEGDKRLVWNRLNMGDISEAERMFNSFIGEGLAAYRVGGDGKQGAAMTKFDPTAEEVIFLPVKLVAGG